MTRFVLPVLLLALGAPVFAASPPLDVALAVDTSASLKKFRGERDAVVARLLAALPDGTRLSLHAFDVEPRLVVRPGGSKDQVARAAARLPASGRHTALNDVLFDATRALADADGRRAVVIVTDGVDENSALDLTDGVAAAREAGVPVYFAGVGRVSEHALRRVAKLTGGAYLPPRTTARTAASAIARGARSGPHADVAPRASSPPSATPPPIAASIPPAAITSSAPPGWAWLLLAVLVLGAVALGVAAFLVRPRAAPSTASPAEVSSSTLAMRLDGIAPVDRTMVLAMRPLLHVTRGLSPGRLFEVSLQRATLIGRAPGNDVILDDAAVSSQHCRVRPAEEGGFELLDTGSTNGSFVNEKRVTRHRLAPGDTIRVGETWMQFRLDASREG